MDLVKLRKDWETDPALSYVAADSVEGLAQALTQAHRYLLDPGQAGPLSYLYQQQVRIVRELKEELAKCRASTTVK